VGGGNSGSPQAINNWLTFNNSTSTQKLADELVQNNGRAVAVRTEYAIAPLTSGYPDTPSSFPLNAPKVANQTWKYANIKTEGFNPSHPYATHYSPSYKIT
jgi:hypothetical protein